MPPALVIFDCDGVLVDSEPLSLRVLTESIAEAGLAMSPGQVQARFLGKSLASTCAILTEEFGVDLTQAHLARMRARLADLFRRELRPIPGIAAALDALRAPRCVASSSQPERIRMSLEVTGLFGRLSPHIFSATMVTHGKPAPDLFLHAAASMGSAPGECVVIEDSPAGIAAARNAGMRVLAFTGGSHATGADHLRTLAEAGPDLVFDDMRLLSSCLARLDR